MTLLLSQTSFTNFMSRWDDRDYDEYDYKRMLEEEEESELVKKFNEYLDLHSRMEKEARKKKNPKFLKNKKTTIALIEGTILSGLTAAFLFLWNINQN